VTDRLTRRGFGALAAAAALTPAGFARAASVLPPSIIAEGGAGEERPEDTRAAYDQAMAEGCDFIQANLFPTKDGALVARRENELSLSTNIAAHPEFAARKATKTIAGADVSGWFVEDFTLAELKTLLCKDRQPGLHPQNNTRYDLKEPMLTLAEVLSVARDGCVRTARTVGVCARVIRAKVFADLDLRVVELLANELTLEGYIADAAAVWVQAEEPEALIAFGKLSSIRRMQIVPAGPQAAGQTSQGGLAQIKSWAEAIAPDQDLVLDPSAATFPVPTTLVMDARSAGLQVFSRVARVENSFLPPALRRGDPRGPNYANIHGDIMKLMTALFANGVDGLATDQVNAASRARDSAIAALRGRPSSGFD
jgi:glycerophosphoryl diester phosphodiesterase